MAGKIWGFGKCGCAQVYFVGITCQQWQHENRTPFERVCYVSKEFSIYFFILMFFILSDAHLALRDTND